MAREGQLPGAAWLFLPADPFRQTWNGPVGSSNRRRNARGADGRHQGRDGCSRSDRAVVFGYSEGANLALLFAATFPLRARALLLWGAQARWIRDDDYPWGPTREEADQEIAYLAEHGVTLEYLTGPGAGIPKDLPYVRFFMRYLKASASPSALAALERMLYLIDMRDILPSVRVPVVVMNRTGDPVANVEAARDFAARIPGARFVEFPGDAHPFFTGPATGEILAEIETFVTGVRPPPAADRVLATVLFTDIVGSTQKLEAIGDQRWRQLLDSHHAQVRQLLEHYAGTEIDTTGDGFFATFDGPTRAIRCACAIRDAVQEIGLEIRRPAYRRDRIPGCQGHRPRGTCGCKGCRSCRAG